MTQSYEEMDAIAMLKADHRKVEEIFASFEKARGKDRKKTLAEQACLELKVHTIIEEEVFYPACRGQIEDDMLDEAYVEHDAAKVLINDIEAGGPDEAFYDAKVKVLSEMIEHHVKEEEMRSEGLFSQARAAGLDMDALADKMRERKKSAMAQLKGRPEIPAETHTFHGDDHAFAMADEPMMRDDKPSAAMEMREAR